MRTIYSSLHHFRKTTVQTFFLANLGDSSHFPNKTVTTDKNKT
ncbi:hypothetical protein HMPREF9439_02315 [Parasutterella excrementihominis YIT 11859]|uniref:Uncharacterized protein n=1 Tax=Parasutterella excrementihominis YIT 11859 TaxID=762966 RepID=F3QMY5_9BURK|nr:hypothetical protein HMPREF9439_02315 [Parasutterella excrementihominis YIT 11859]